MAKYVLKEDVEEPKAYCMKCKKKKRKIMNGELVKAEGAERYFFKGTHKVCGLWCFRLLYLKIASSRLVRKRRSRRKARGL